MIFNKTIGSTFMIAGTALGAGMLALPLVTAGEGIITATVLLVLIWALMLYTALLILDINLTFPLGASFDTMARSLLGRFGSLTALISILLLFYALCTAYISGGSQLMAGFLSQQYQTKLVMATFAIIFTLVFSLVICWKTIAVDCVNRFLFTLKMFALIASVLFLMRHIHFDFIYNNAHRINYMWASIPVIFTAFGFHGSIPSVVKYIGHDRARLRKIIIIGGTIPLIIYFFWLLAALLIIPLEGQLSYAQILQSNHSVSDLIKELSLSSNHVFIKIGINLFSDIAVTTSFLGVGLGLFDYFYDLFKGLKKYRRFLSGIATFLPPLFIALFFQNIFIVALGFAAIMLSILAVVLPGLMGLSRKFNGAAYTASDFPISRSRYYIVIALGFFIILVQLLSMFHYFSIFS